MQTNDSTEVEGIETPDARDGLTIPNHTSDTEATA